MDQSEQVLYNKQEQLQWVYRYAWFIVITLLFSPVGDKSHPQVLQGGDVVFPIYHLLDIVQCVHGVGKPNVHGCKDMEPKGIITSDM